MDRTVVALFDDMTTAERAVQELVSNGFNRDQISLVASDRVHTDSGEVSTGSTMAETPADGAAAGAGIGAVLGGLAGLLVGIGALAIPGIGPIIAAGPLAAALAGAGLGAATGGVIGALVDAGVPEEEAQYYAEGVRRGGILVTLRADEGSMSRAMAILNRYSPVDINQRVASWRESGWRGSDADTGAYRDTGYTNTTASGYTGTGAGSTSGGAGTMGSRATDGGTGYVETQHTGTGSGATGRGSGTVGSGTGYSGTTRDMNSRETRDTAAGASSGSGSSDSSDSGALLTGRDGQSQASRFDADGDQTSYGTGTGGTVAGGSGVGRYTEPSLGTSTSGSYPVGRSDPSATYRSFQDNETYFRQDYQQRYANTGFGYDRYQPAYRFGYDLHGAGRYDNRNWAEIEPEVRREWEHNHPGNAWEDFKDSVRSGWERFKQGVSDTFDTDNDYYQQDYQQHYARSGFGYERYQPAYRYGYDLANDERYRGRGWYEVEADARRDWQARHPDSSWDDFKDAVRHGWNRVRESVRDTFDSNR